MSCGKPHSAWKSIRRWLKSMQLIPSCLNSLSPANRDSTVARARKSASIYSARTEQSPRVRPVAPYLANMSCKRRSTASTVSTPRDPSDLSRRSVSTVRN